MPARVLPQQGGTVVRILTNAAIPQSVNWRAATEDFAFCHVVQGDRWRVERGQASAGPWRLVLGRAGLAGERKYAPLLARWESIGHRRGRHRGSMPAGSHAACYYFVAAPTGFVVAKR